MLLLRTLLTCVTLLGLLPASGLFAEEKPPTLQVGAAWSEMQADDSMIIGGGIGPATVAGQEGRLQATATVIFGNQKLCLVAVDVLMMNRDYLDEAARRIEKECGIPFDHILINSSHTHHAAVHRDDPRLRA